MLKKRLGEQIAILRKEAELTQEALAEATDYSVEFISLVERGINAPSIDGCERIAKALEVHPKELFNFD
ncbi:helix-turn-helix domain-containing protein [Puniceicoccaceae bacterium K14]|nr:helix-turn-helix domain-containing protein [Puniceicoccaceae bacterium K14]